MWFTGIPVVRTGETRVVFVVKDEAGPSAGHQETQWGDSALGSDLAKTE